MSFRVAYDADGNLTARAGDSLTYDAESRLHSVTTAGETITFTYDGDGRRVMRDTITGTIAYVGPHYELRFTKTNKPEDLDDDCVVTVIDIMRVAKRWGQAGGPEDLDGDGTVDVDDVQQVAGHWRETCHVLAETVKYYSLGGRRVAMRRGSTLYYLFADHLGSTSVSYREDGGDTKTQRYYPWGMIRPGPDNALPTDYTFTGQKLDASTGLMYYGARYYEPALGRFVQPDTIVPEPGNPQSLNRYSYVLNNPLRHTDPDGHDWQDSVNFVLGFVAQWGYNNAWVLPQTQEALAAKPNEPLPMTAGRHLGNVVAVLQGLAEVAGGTGAAGGGAVVCLSGVGCVAGAPVAVGGVAVAAHGTTVGLMGAAQEGQMLGKLVMMAGEAGNPLAGQVHHILSRKILDALNKHDRLKGVFSREDLVTQAADLEAHKGYQRWHRAYDEEVVRWLSRNRNATRDEFLNFLEEIYSREDMRKRFPDALDVLEQAR